ncbi:MAG TPA: response regulator [Bryobacteraceae bacterium]|nr:response regulator [Bryobacteraceae bacterium]
MPAKTQQDISAAAQHSPAILVVAEEDNVRDLMQDILEAYGYRTRPSTNLEEAATLASKESVDLVAVELDRPGPRQVAGIEALRRSRTGLKIIAVLGDSSLACLESLVDGIVWKPFSVNALATIVSEYIGPAEPTLKETAQLTAM